MPDSRMTIVMSGATAARNALKVRLSKRCMVLTAVALVLLVGFGVAGSWRVHRCVQCMHTVTYLEQVLAQDPAGPRLAQLHAAYQRYSGFIGIDSQYPSLPSEYGGRGGEQPVNEPVASEYAPPARESSALQQLPTWQQASILRQDYLFLRESLQHISQQLRYRPTIMPVQSDELWITSNFGWRRSPFTDRREFHSGLDISGRRGTPIAAPADGIVEKAGFNRFLGHYVKIRHDERYLTIYGHLLKYTVSKHDTVRRGQVIGYMGTSGMSTGYHLHYEVHDRAAAVNPREFILDRLCS